MAKGSMTTNSTVDTIDKTLTISGAPADAKAVGDIILDRTKETPQPIFYSKVEVDKLLEDCKEAAKRAALLAANPVGKLWGSDDPTSPASIVGGTWEQIKDKFILAAGDTYAAGSTGGEAAHTLTVKEMPKHDHGVSNGTALLTTTSSMAVNQTAVASGPPNITSAAWFAEAGGSAAHNNMPPYTVAYVWRRIA